MSKGALAKIPDVLEALVKLNQDMPETEAAAKTLLQWCSTEDRQFVLYEFAVVLLAMKPVAILKGAQVLQEMIQGVLGPVSSAPGQVH